MAELSLAGLSLYSLVAILAAVEYKILDRTQGEWMTAKAGMKIRSLFTGKPLQDIQRAWAGGGPSLELVHRGRNTSRDTQEQVAKSKMKHIQTFWLKFNSLRWKLKAILYWVIKTYQLPVAFTVRGIVVL